ncbi:MAG: Sensor protein ZraS [Candidatus Heimdallarchaeota archaeon LC_3]|nr:MAG: Sensor protein ZraS [Candidatus Heimdallarchaeota archaeon LC_3]
MGLRILEETTLKASNHPYLIGIVLSLALFILWQISDFIVFGYLAANYLSDLQEILVILRGLANAIVIAFIIVGFSLFITRVENIKQIDRLTIMNNMHDGLLEVGKNGKILFANDQIKSLLQLPESIELENKSFDFLLPFESDTSDFEEFLSKNNLLSFELKPITRNKEFSLKSFNSEIIPVLASATFLKNTNRFLLVFTDIKELRNAQDQIRYLMHIEKVSALGHLVSGIGHEINNPLSFLINDFDRLENHIEKIFDIFTIYESCVSSFEKNYKNHPEFSEFNNKIENIIRLNKKLVDIREDINEIVSNQHVGLKKITNVVKDLREYSSMGSVSKKDLHQLNDIIMLPLSLVKEQFVDRIKFETSLDPNLPEVLINPDRMTQVVMNIVLNSIQAIKGSGIIKIKTYVEEKTLMTCLEIHDTGSGIKEEDLTKIFEPYFTTKRDGTGLGLGIVKNIIDDHKGTISVRSDQNKGTTMIIKLPKNT